MVAEVVGATTIALISCFLDFAGLGFAVDNSSAEYVKLSSYYCTDFLNPAFLRQCQFFSLTLTIALVS